MGRPPKDISIRAIAKAADVSIATVSRVLNNRIDVSPEVRERVQRVMQANDFSPSATSNGKRKSIGVVILDENPALSEYCSEVLLGAMDISATKGVDLTLMLHYARGAHTRSVVKSLRERGCHAAIILCPHKMKEQLKELADSGIPSALINWRDSLGKFACVDSDGFKAGYSLGSYLAGLGHRSFAILQNIPAQDHIAREDGFRKALEDAGLQQESCLTIPLAHGESIVDSGIIQASQALKACPRLTAIVAINDTMAYGAVNACIQSGRRVPEDISVAGFDDYPVSRHFIPSLTTVRQPLAQMGRIAAEYALAAIKAKDVQPPSVVLPTELVVRSSTSKPKE